MNFDFNCERILRADYNGYIILHSTHKSLMSVEYDYYFRQVINAIGKAAGYHRRCKYPLTQAETFFNKDNEVLIIKTKGYYVYGYIRAGYRNVYVHTLQDELTQMNLLCVFDFYVHVNIQRRGIGKEIFNMLLYTYNNVKPCYIAYDCPTQAMIDFLYKHYGLICPIYQHNNMVIYKELLMKYERQLTMKMNHNVVGHHNKMNSVLQDCGRRVINDFGNTQGQKKVNGRDDALKWMNGEYRNKFKDCYLNNYNMNHSNNIRNKGNDRYNEERDYLGKNIRLEKELYKNRKENIEQLERFVNYNGRYNYDNNNRENNNHYYLKKNEYATVFDTL